jgi:hypothetical protein
VVTIYPGDESPGYTLSVPYGTTPPYKAKKIKTTLRRGPRYEYEHQALSYPEQLIEENQDTRMEGFTCYAIQLSMQSPQGKI